jgi:hypothetical protein
MTGGFEGEDSSRFIGPELGERVLLRYLHHAAPEGEHKSLKLGVHP